MMMNLLGFSEFTTGFLSLFLISCVCRTIIIVRVNQCFFLCCFCVHLLWLLLMLLVLSDFDRVFFSTEYLYILFLPFVFFARARFGFCRHFSYSIRAYSRNTLLFFFIWIQYTKCFNVKTYIFWILTSKSMSAAVCVWQFICWSGSYTCLLDQIRTMSNHSRSTTLSNAE